MLDILKTYIKQWLKAYLLKKLARLNKKVDHISDRVKKYD